MLKKGLLVATGIEHIQLREVQKLQRNSRLWPSLEILGSCEDRGDMPTACFWLNLARWRAAEGTTRFAFRETKLGPTSKRNSHDADRGTRTFYLACQNGRQSFIEGNPFNQHVEFFAFERRSLSAQN